jgi:hypothetical protein
MRVRDRAWQRMRLRLTMNRDRAGRRCELDGVRHEIPQHLRYAHRVAYHLQRLVLPPFVSRQLPVPYRTRERERDILLLRLHGETRRRLLHYLPYRQRGEFQAQRPRLDLESEKGRDCEKERHRKLVVRIRVSGEQVLEGLTLS